MSDFEKHAYSVNDRITDGTVRNMNIMIAVGELKEETENDKIC